MSISAPTPRQIRRYGWRPQLPDHRDHIFVPTVTEPVVDLVPELVLPVGHVPVLNQLQQGSCVGHGTVGIVMANQQKQGEAVVIPSRAFVYYVARLLEGTQDSDSGAEVRDGVKAVVRWGVPTEAEFPYNPDVYNVAPSNAVYSAATKEQALVYEAVKYGRLRQAISSGYPFVFGFTVYTSFESDAVSQTGIMPMPGAGEQIVGGHCVWAYGYNNQTKTIRCRNSWGADWGDKGDFHMPFAYFDAGLCSDYWVIRKMS